MDPRGDARRSGDEGEAPVPYAQVGDIEMYYEQGGDEAGPALLVIGGSGGDLRHEPSFLRGPLADDFALLSFDQRGLGRTSKPDQRTTMARYAADAVALLDAVGWKHCHVLGVSFGGMVAQEVALRASERVDRLVLCCTSSGGRGGASYPLHELETLPDDERLATSIHLSDERWDEAWRAANPEIVDLFRTRGTVGDADDASRAGAHRQLEARAAHDTFDRLTDITMPVLVCAGRYDRIAPLSNAEAMTAQLPDAQLRVFEGGHLFLVQDPQAWPAIAAFLKAT